MLGKDFIEVPGKKPRDGGLEVMEESSFQSIRRLSKSRLA